MKKAPNWNELYTRLKNIYSQFGYNRKVAVLDNYQHQKEKICRKLGVISNADLSRISRDLKERSKSTQ